MIRDKRRYLLVETAEPLGDADTERALYKELIRVIGEEEYPIVNPRFVKAIDSQHFIIRSSAEGQGKLVLALAFMRAMNGKPNAFYTLGASGTIRALMKNAGYADADAPDRRQSPQPI